MSHVFESHLVHDIHYGPNFYKLKFLGKLVVQHGIKDLFSGGHVTCV